MKQTIKKSRREYNRWVANESLEDYALRYSPASFRQWSPFLLANTALGGISFLVLEAIGAVLLLNYGFSNAFWAILLASIIIFIAGVPIAYYAARYNVDIDLLTRGAGFGYVGSTVTSLIYASFCFIFFALEASIMAQALQLYFGLPLSWGYLVCSLIIIPIVFYGVTAINKLQSWTQPVWLVLMILPFYFVLTAEPKLLAYLVNFSGKVTDSREFNLYYFGIAAGISFSLIGQIGEQVDYLRFMPDKHKANRYSWWFSLLLAGPGWILLGCLKQWGGALLAALVVFTHLGMNYANEPVYMYLSAYQYVFANPEIALLVTTIFVIVSQIKINVTNAYAGSLAWSNFFSRTTHAHPGRVLWVVFNTVIALLLMEIGIFDMLNKVLGLYSNVAIAWIFTVFADLVINKPLKLSPPFIEFKRAYLYDVNPVGLGSMLLASVLSILAFFGLFGEYAQAFSWLIALLASLIFSPMIAYITQGKYYIARENDYFKQTDSLITCHICEKQYAEIDMAYCPFYEAPICSLCCTLDVSCYAQCKSKQKTFYRQLVEQIATQLLRQKIALSVVQRVFNITLILGVILSIISAVFWLAYSDIKENLSTELLTQYINSQSVLLGIITIIVGVFAWWVVLSAESQTVAESELNARNEELKQEVLERKKAENQIKQLAFYDSLTGLVNRRYFQDQGEQSIARAERKQSKLALLMLDLDRFKPVNDSLGHLAGDELLQQVAQRIVSQVREVDMVARIGGDEFVVLLENLTCREDAARIAKKIISKLSEKFQLTQNNEVSIGASIGISLYPEGGRFIATLLDNADLALYHVKDNGRGHFAYFSENLTKKARTKLQLETRLRYAITHNELCVFYQPQIDINSGELIGAEALVRWQDPENGLIPPNDFIPIAEESALIIALGEWVLQEVCQQGKQWIDAGFQPIRLAVNVAARQFKQSDMQLVVGDVLQKTQFPANYLELEMTESSLIEEQEKTIAVLNQLRLLGIHLAIDDFGTGYSSLAYLKRFPLDVLKIDKSFIDDIPHDNSDMEISATIIAMGKILGFKVLAEGVETKEQLDFLAEKGCDIYQGYLKSKPMNAVDFEKFLSR